MRKQAKKGAAAAAQDGGSQFGASSQSHASSTQTGGSRGSRPGYDSNGNQIPGWLYQTIINGGYKCERDRCIFDHKKVDWNTMLKTMRPPKWVCVDYENGRGKSKQQAWIDLFKKMNPFWLAKGKGKGGKGEKVRQPPAGRTKVKRAMMLRAKLVPTKGTESRRQRPNQWQTR